MLWVTLVVDVELWLIWKLSIVTIASDDAIEGLELSILVPMIVSEGAVEGPESVGTKRRVLIPTELASKLGKMIGVPGSLARANAK